MAKELVLIDREALGKKLQAVFDGQTADTLLSVLDSVAKQVYAAGVTREDFNELKQIVADIAEELCKVSEEQHKLAEEVRKLAESLRHSEERLSRLETTVASLAEEVRELIKSQQRLIIVVNGLKTDIKGLKTDVGKVKGRTLESAYREKAPAYFGRLLGRPRVITVLRLWGELEAHLSQEELDDLIMVDLLVKGKLRKQSEREDFYLAVEVSSVVDLNDVQRASRRATLLRKAGFRAIPVVAGEDTTAGAENEARNQGVAILQDGRKFLWAEALALWTKNE